MQLSSKDVVVIGVDCILMQMYSLSVFEFFLTSPTMLGSGLSNRTQLYLQLVQCLKSHCVFLFKLQTKIQNYSKKKLININYVTCILHYAYVYTLYMYRLVYVTYKLSTIAKKTKNTFFDFVHKNSLCAHICTGEQKN